MQGHMTRLTALQAELEKLPQEEAETIAEYVSAKQIIELNNRLMNAYDSLQEGPSSVVRAEVRKMSAQARITEQLAGTDVKLQDQQYAQLGREMAGETLSRPSWPLDARSARVVVWRLRRRPNGKQLRPRLSPPPTRRQAARRPSGRQI